MEQIPMASGIFSYERSVGSDEQSELSVSRVMFKVPPWPLPTYMIGCTNENTDEVPGQRPKGTHSLQRRRPAIEEERKLQGLRWLYRFDNRRVFIGGHPSWSKSERKCPVAVTRPPSGLAGASYSEADR